MITMQGVDSSSYPALLKPFALAGRDLRNRVLHPSMTTQTAHGGVIPQTLIQYHVSRAQGGAALTVTEPLGMAPHQRQLPRPQIIPANFSRLGEWAEAVETLDCRLIGQIQDSGRGRHYSGRTHDAVGASALPDDLSWTVPRTLDTDEIEAMIEHFAQASLDLQRCGFSGVELSAGHGHLFHQFLSPWSNRREDRYGGDWDGRVRFIKELIAAIRTLCGPGFIIGLKLPGNDGIKDSIGHAEARIVASLLTRSREADYICFAYGAHAKSLEMHVPDRYEERLPYLDAMRDLRGQINGTALVALGRITDPAEAESILAAGDAELVGLGRALIADPAWLKKAATNRAHDIRYCISCNTCWGTIITHKAPIACVNNPRVGLAAEADFWPRPIAKTKRKRIAVIGAGVAGLEAAWVAAARGHDVTVFGASAEVGGKARIRAPLPGGETITSIFDYQFTAAERARAHFRLGQAATADDINELAPAAVILATGAKMIPPDWLPAEARDFVEDLRTAIAPVITTTVRQPGTAVLFDADHSEATYASAEALAAVFEQVVIVTPRDTIATEMQLVTRQGVIRRLAQKRIRIVTRAVPEWSETLDEGALECVNVYTGDRERIENVAFLSYATPRTPIDDLVKPLTASGFPIHRVGDCQSAADLLSATASGHSTGLSI